MKLLSDENIPSKLTRFIASLGHDIIAGPNATPDIQLIERALKEKRVIITLDRDFEILSASFPINVIVVRIHPPYVKSLIRAFERLHKEAKLEDIQGLNLLSESGLLKVL
jgi:predicted nuclease of predicted toxin-antitoxin system